MQFYSSNLRFSEDCNFLDSCICLHLKTDNVYFQHLLPKVDPNFTLISLYWLFVGWSFSSMPVTCFFVALFTFWVALSECVGYDFVRRRSICSNLIFFFCCIIKATAYWSIEVNGNESSDYGSVIRIWPLDFMLPNLSLRVCDLRMTCISEVREELYEKWN